MDKGNSFANGPDGGASVVLRLNWELAEAKRAETSIHNLP